MTDPIEHEDPKRPHARQRAGMGAVASQPRSRGTGTVSERLQAWVEEFQAAKKRGVDPVS